MPIEQGTEGPRDRGNMERREVDFDAAGYQGRLGSRGLGAEATGMPDPLGARDRLNEEPWLVR
jgi:hypothetical protein